MPTYRGIGTTDTTGAIGSKQTEEVQTATASQTVFTLTTMTYDYGDNNLIAYINGVRQETSGYTENIDGVTITFSEGLDLNDSVAFVSGEILSSSALTSDYIFTGTGTPEGSITAAIGSIYGRLDGGTGTSLYVKESGISNIGWVAK